MHRQLGLFETQERTQDWRSLPDKTREELIRICALIAAPAIQAGEKVTDDEHVSPNKDRDTTS
jgi:hypothetical protein